jgi:hypothetical protein
MPIILASWEAETGRIEVLGQQEGEGRSFPDLK